MSNTRKTTNQAVVPNPEAKRKRKRQYSDADKAVALVAIDGNGGNVKRTAIQLGIPHKTLDDWAKGRNQNPAVAELHTRKKGSLADKFENLAHLLVDAMPEKIAKATLSQCAITSGIATDKAIRLRGEGLYPDPAAELCHLLKINRSQLPERLELKAGEEIPEGYSQFFETKANAEGQYEIENPSQSADGDATEADAHSVIDTNELRPVN
jgi:transposase-like protein